MPRATRSNISARRIREIILYDPESGITTRRSTGGMFLKATLKVDGERHELSRYIWLYHYGEWPPLDKLVDHADRNRYNNKIENLRLANYMENGYNSDPRLNDTGYKGVTASGRKSKPWAAYIRIDGVKTNLGRFQTKEEAAQAYQEACIKYHGEFACPT